MVNGTMIEIDGGQDKPLMDRFRDKNRSSLRRTASLTLCLKPKCRTLPRRRLRNDYQA